MAEFEPVPPLRAPTRPRRSDARWVRVAALALGTAALWAAWLGWDRTYDVDPVTGDQTGPYQPWQVVGCVVSLVVLSALAARWLNLWAIVITVSLVFTLAFAVSGATSPEADGLWAVGAVMVFFGAAIGSAIVGGVSKALWRGGKTTKARD